MKKIKTNELSKDTKASLKKRVITGLVMAAIALPCIIIGNWVFFVFILVLSIMGAYELVHITKIDGKLRIVIYVATITLVIMLINYIFFKNNWDAVKSGAEISAWNFVNNNFENIELSSMLIILTVITFFFISFVTPKMSMFHVFYFICMIIVISLGLQAFLYLRFSPFKDNPGLVNDPVFQYFGSLLLAVYVVLGTIMNDIGAYFIGILFGKHKMNPRISPKKTWEGFAGGIFFSALFSIMFALIVALCGKPILPRFDLNQFYWVVIISFVMPLAADVGDFVFSAIKRNAGIKDFSNLLPGHGGLLDRIDSLLFAGGSVAAMIALMDFISPLIQQIGEVA